MSLYRSAMFAFREGGLNPKTLSTSGCVSRVVCDRWAATGTTSGASTIRMELAVLECYVEFVFHVVLDTCYIHPAYQD